MGWMVCEREGGHLSEGSERMISSVSDPQGFGFRVKDLRAESPVRGLKAVSKRGA